MFNPLQTQTALQNPARFPDQRLQQYAAGQPPQPTGQVMPGPLGPAGLELASRNAQRQAAGRAQAMQNNPQESPTVFQQKDAELAAMKQQMQQKEQHFGLMGAMLAKKAQDLQARERGIAAIPMRDDIFTAMDGGIVFSGGGGVQRFNGRFDSLISPEFGGVTPGLEELNTLRVEEAKRKKDKERYEFLKEVSPVAAERFAQSNPHVLTENLETDREISRLRNRGGPGFVASTSSPSSGSGSRDRSGSGAPSAVAAPSLAQGASFQDIMKELSPYLNASVSRSESKKITEELIANNRKIEAAVAAGLMTEEEGKSLAEAKIAEMAAQYADYTKGREARREKTRAALEGEAPTFQQRMASALANIPANISGMRLGQGLAMLGAGAGKADTEYANRKREAAKYLAEAEELDARADLAERRGQSKEAEAFRDKAEDRRLRNSQINVSMLQAGQGGLRAALEQARVGETDEARILSGIAQAASGIASTQLSTDATRDVAKYRADTEAAAARQRANEPSQLLKQVREVAKMLGVSEREAFALLKPAKATQKYSDPAKALETVRAIPFNDPMLVSRAGLTSDEMMKLGRSKTFADLPPVTQGKLNRAYETIFEQLTTGAADASRYE